MSLLQYLPAQSFVPFVAQRLQHATELWRCPQLHANTNLMQYAYAKPIDGEDLAAYSSQTRTFMGERYGGEYIGYNGGGVRCGVRGAIQIKGIGNNQLGSEQTDYWHRFGGASLEEGLREVIWSEVCHHALPFGAVRVLGLLATGTHIPYLAVEGQRTAQRVLILRQTAARPAHFMRASFFRPSPEMAAFVSDAQRTRQSVQKFAATLRSLFPQLREQTLDEPCINLGLQEMLQRFAIQIAAASAKRIMHGMLGSSNLALDGRWLDFGTITTVSDYGRLIVGNNDTADFVHQYQVLLKCITDLHFYLQKYLPQHTLSSVAQLQATYLHTYRQRHLIEMCKLSGIPEQALLRMPRQYLQDFYATLQGICARGNREPFKLAPNHCWQMPKKMGQFHLNSIVRAAAVCSNADQMDQVLREELADSALRQRFIHHWQQLRLAYFAQAEVRAMPFAASFVAFNALRINSDFAALYRPEFEVLASDLAKKITDGGSPYPTIEKFTQQAIDLYAEPQQERISLNTWCKEPSSLSAHHGAQQAGQAISLMNLSTQLCSAFVPATLHSLLDPLCRPVPTP